MENKKQKLVEIRKKAHAKQEAERLHRQELIDAIRALHSLFEGSEDANSQSMNQLLDKLSMFDQFKQEVSEVKKAIKSLPKVESVSVNNLSELISAQKDIDLSEVTRSINNLTEIVKNQTAEVTISNKRADDFIPTRRVREVNGRFIFDDSPMQVSVVGGGGAMVASVQPELIENGKIKVTTEGATTERFDLSDPDIIYTGSAAVGADESAPGWTITKYDLSDPSNTSGKVALGAVWSERLTETYL